MSFALITSISYHKLTSTFSTGLFSVSIRQALFIAPCSHTFHYKCIRPLLESHHPAFSCPLCRTFADLEEDVEVEIEYEEESNDCDKDGSGDCDIDIDVETSDDQGHVVSVSQQPGLDDVHGDRASPLIDLTDEPDKELVMEVSQPAPSGGEMGVLVVGGDTDRVMDDATVGAAGKRLF